MQNIHVPAFLKRDAPINPVAQEALDQKRLAFLDAASSLSRKQLAEEIVLLCERLRDPQQVNAIIDGLAKMAKPEGSK